MKKVNLSQSRKNSILILGLLFIANLAIIGFANNYFNHRPEKSNTSHVIENDAMMESGWKLFNWGFALMEYFKYEQN